MRLSGLDVGRGAGEGRFDFEGGASILGGKL